MRISGPKDKVLKFPPPHTLPVSLWVLGVIARDSGVWRVLWTNTPPPFFFWLNTVIYLKILYFFFSNTVIEGVPASHMEGDVEGRV